MCVGEWSLILACCKVVRPLGVGTVVGGDRVPSICGNEKTFLLRPLEYSGLISFRMDWLDLLVVQRTLNCPLQHHSSKASIPRCSAFFMVQPSHPYMTTGKTIALTRWTFVGKVMYENDVGQIFFKKEGW